VQLEASIARCTYFIRGDPHEIVAWAEVRDVGGRRRVEIGSFRSVVEARGACERDAVARCRREAEERGPVDVRIAPRRPSLRGRVSIENEGTGVRARDVGAALDAALGAFMPSIED
jgi:hypothetical protein